MGMSHSKFNIIFPFDLNNFFNFFDLFPLSVDKVLTFILIELLEPNITRVFNWCSLAKGHVTIGANTNQRNSNERSSTHVGVRPREVH